MCKSRGFVHLKRDISVVIPCIPGCIKYLVDSITSVVLTTEPPPERS